MADTIDELKTLSKMIKEVEFYHLQVEVTRTALQAMKDNPKLSVTEAYHIGCCEWDCI